MLEIYKEKDFNPWSYYTIYGWMITRLDLKGINLLVYAIIYSYSSNDDAFFGVQNYLAEITNSTRRSIVSTIKYLEEHDLIEKKMVIWNNKKKLRYKAKPIDFSKEVELPKNKKLIREDASIYIYFWMLDLAKLKGNDLIIYSTIYRIDLLGEYYGSVDHLSAWCNCTRRGVFKNINNLVESKMLFRIKGRYFINTDAECLKMLDENDDIRKLREKSYIAFENDVGDDPP